LVVLARFVPLHAGPATAAEGRQGPNDRTAIFVPNHAALLASAKLLGATTGCDIGGDSEKTPLRSWDDTFLPGGATVRTMGRESRVCCGAGEAQSLAIETEWLATPTSTVSAVPTLPHSEGADIEHRTL
jgi:hypothetical protein